MSGFIDSDFGVFLTFSGTFLTKNTKNSQFFPVFSRFSPKKNVFANFCVFLRSGFMDKLIGGDI